MQKRNGFTVIEAMIMVIVIGILAGLVLVVFNRTQAEARDKKRKADVEILTSLLEGYHEKNGEYPTGSSVGLSPGVNTPNTDNYTSNTTISQLKESFPSLSDSFGDPKDETKDTPFAKSTEEAGYVYVGAKRIQPSYMVGESFNNLPESRFGCGPDVGILVEHLTSPKSVRTSFVLAYKAEADGKWYFYQGKNGSSNKDAIYRDTHSPDPYGVGKYMPVRGTTQGNCVFM